MNVVARNSPSGADETCVIDRFNHFVGQHGRALAETRACHVLTDHSTSTTAAPDRGWARR